MTWWAWAIIGILCVHRAYCIGYEIGYYRATKGTRDG